MEDAYGCIGRLRLIHGKEQVYDADDAPTVPAADTCPWWHTQGRSVELDSSGESLKRDNQLPKRSNKDAYADQIKPEGRRFVSEQ
jgi:hypothetical protein